MESQFKDTNLISLRPACFIVPLRQSIYPPPQSAVIYTQIHTDAHWVNCHPLLFHIPIGSGSKEPRRELLLQVFLSVPLQAQTKKKYEYAETEKCTLAQVFRLGHRCLKPLNPQSNLRLLLHFREQVFHPPPRMGLGFYLAEIRIKSEIPPTGFFIF